MKYIIIILLVISNIDAKVITSKPPWATTTRNNAIYGAFCDMNFDTDNGNYTYDCKGVKLSEFNVADINGFIVGSDYISMYNRSSGHGTIENINGIPYSFNGSRGDILDSTSYFMRCVYGYIQTSYDSEYCITKPDNSLYGAYEGAEYGYRCISGYDDIDGNCVKSCKYNQFFNGDECINIPKHAYKTSYDNYECNQGYEYQERSVQRCVKSCNDNEVMDSLFRCKSLYTNEFKKHCSDRINGITGDTTKTCDNGWDYCVKEDQHHAVKLTLNARSVENDCVTIRSCNDGYVLTNGKCVIDTPTYIEEPTVVIEEPTIVYDISDNLTTYCKVINLQQLELKCKDGYTWMLTGDNNNIITYMKLPANTSSTYLDGSSASCNDGYIKDTNGNCVIYMR